MGQFKGLVLPDAGLFGGLRSSPAEQICCLPGHLGARAFVFTFFSFLFLLFDSEVGCFVGTIPVKGLIYSSVGE